MTIRISMAIPGTAQGKFGLVLPDDVDSSAAGDLVANTLRILRDEADRPDKGIVRLVEEVAFGPRVELTDDQIQDLIKAGKLDKDGYPPIELDNYANMHKGIYDLQKKIKDGAGADA